MFSLVRCVAILALGCLAFVLRILLISTTILSTTIQLLTSENRNLMYVCVCRAVTERDIQNAVEKGACCMQELQDTLNVSTVCGACQGVAEACFERFAGVTNATNQIAA